MIDNRDTTFVKDGKTYMITKRGLFYIEGYHLVETEILRLARRSRTRSRRPLLGRHHGRLHWDLSVPQLADLYARAVDIRGRCLGWRRYRNGRGVCRRDILLRIGMDQGYRLVG